MVLKEYKESEREFSKDTICFAVVPDFLFSSAGYRGYRFICWSNREANDDATNGIRRDWKNNTSKFFPFLTKREITDIAFVLAEESEKHTIAFVLDDKLTEEEGCGVLRFYEMKMLCSPVVK
jgi:hypothetical protein